MTLERKSTLRQELSAPERAEDAWVINLMTGEIIPRGSESPMLRMPYPFKALGHVLSALFRRPRVGLNVCLWLGGAPKKVRGIKREAGWAGQSPRSGPEMS